MTPAECGSATAALIRRYFEEVWNEGRLEVLDEIIDPEYLNHSPSIANPRPGPADLKPIVTEMRRTFRGLHYEILDMVVAQDKVAIYLHMTGSYGERQIDVRQMQIEWIRNGRIWQHWRLTDEAALLRQMST